MSASKRKRISGDITDILSNLESSDKKAAKLRRSQISTQTLPKSFAAKSQIDIQTNLMECRILMQRSLTSLPIVSDDENNSNVSESLDQLMSQLMNARRTLCSSALQKEDDGNNETASESSSSDSDDDMDNDEDSEHKLNKSLKKEYAMLRNTWKTTLNKHHANINLQNQQNKNKFQVVDQSFWAQIESNVKHTAILEQTHNNDDSDDGDDDKVNNKEASIGFDDSKLYQHMLQEYITLSAERGKNSAAMAAVERLKRSMKKKSSKKRKDVDRKASKGRKIRYVVHEKLKNFTFPVQRFDGIGNTSGPVMEEDVLFKSMLGGVSNI